MCIRCAGIHRNLGVHISRVKSVNLDQWTPEQIQVYAHKQGQTHTYNTAVLFCQYCCSLIIIVIYTTLKWLTAWTWFEAHFNKLPTVGSSAGYAGTNPIQGGPAPQRTGSKIINSYSSFKTQILPADFQTCTFNWFQNRNSPQKVQQKQWKRANK